MFEKANDTFAARHHLRIWRRPGQFGGQSVWVCSATHDINIKFSDQQRTFIHKIDSNIDLERAKVVSDLCSREWSKVSRWCNAPDYRKRCRTPRATP